MLKFTNDDILKANVEALVNTVNCVGVMGKGLALQFKQRFPKNFKAYKKACLQGMVQPGRVFVYEIGIFERPRYILNFPTKRHWKENSRIDDIRAGLNDLVKIVNELKIKSIAIPPLGCGNGKLFWPEVRKLITDAFLDMDDVVIEIFDPCEPKTQISIQTTKPKMTRGRALIIMLIGRYKEAQYSLSLIEIQKLAYFLQEAGESLKLNFEQAYYGPFANNLYKVLSAMEGHYIKGFDSNNAKPYNEIELVDNIIKDAADFLKNETKAMQHLEIVEQLIDGFETPYGLELLATVHWVVHHARPQAHNLSEAIDLIHKWSPEKKRKFTLDHIETTWNHLNEMNWLHFE